MPLTRRQFAASSLAFSTAFMPLAISSSPRLKIVFAGGHPGDPECGCAGTISRYTSLGHDVALLYLNRGEGFCNFGTDCAKIRAAEARRACQILKARPLFASQIDGEAILDNAHYDEFRLLLDAEKPDILFAQWPIDQHRDHRAVSQLALDAWLNSNRKSAFLYYEVADDTMMFSPTDFVDISEPEVQSLRHAACYSHASQQPDRWFPRQLELTRFRGTQSGHSQAEAVLRHWQSPSAFLP